MHVVMATIGSAGDVLPVVSLGKRLRERGHRVTVLTNPYFRDAVTDAGLGLVPLGSPGDFAATVGDPALWHRRKAFATLVRRAVLPAMRPTYDYLAGLDPDDTVLAASSLALGARLAHERLGLPLVGVHLQPSLFLSAYDNAELGPVKAPDWLPVGAHAWRLAQLERLVSDPLLAPAVNAFRAELGLRPVRRILGRWAPSPQTNLGLFPEWFAEPRPDWPTGIRLTGFVGAPSEDRLPLAVQEALADGERPVVVTLGSAMVHGRRLFKAAIRAARRRGRRVVVLSRFPGQLPPVLPAGVVHAEWAPLGRLLPHVAAFVHHGGIGTVAQALAAGVPQLVVPFAHDQPDNANRLTALGVARRVDAGAFTADSVGRALDALLDDPGVRERCARYAARVDFAAATEAACGALEAAASA